MLGQARYNKLRKKMQAIKGLYVSRHYTQCTRYGERLLEEIQDGEIHPIHQAYLNFYTALSHDTLAREASLKNRFNSLSLAEKHYMAAIAALTPSHDQQSRNTPEEGAVWRLRRSSSAASSENAENDAMQPLQTLEAYRRPYSPDSLGTTSCRHRSIMTITSMRPQTPEEYQIAADTMDFVRMIRSHLANVQELRKKTNERSMQSSRASQQISPMSGNRTSSPRLQEMDAKRQSVRAERMAMKWRPRFDPSSVQQLCHEALVELC